MIRLYHAQQEAGLNRSDTDSDHCYLWAVRRRSIGREGAQGALGERRGLCVDEHGCALVKTQHSVCALLTYRIKTQ